MPKIISEYIKDKGIIRCETARDGVFYLDIEAHLLMTERELLELIYERSEKVGK